MKITYQGAVTSTDATTVAGFLESVGVAAKSAIIELNGEIVHDPSVPLTEGAELNAYRIVAGG